MKRLKWKKKNLFKKNKIMAKIHLVFHKLSSPVSKKFSKK